jgi:hypothetical protein
MRNILYVLPFVAMTFLCWGNYGPIMHEGQHAMGNSSLRPFVCVGLAYFLIAVVIPVVWLSVKGEKGNWTAGGLFWSLTAGVVTCVGALGIIMAFKFRGKPVYVMPLVFGAAPVVNTIVTMFMTKTYRDAKWIFYAGVLTVAAGGAGVLFFKPQAEKHTAGNADQAQSVSSFTYSELDNGMLKVTVQDRSSPGLPDKGLTADNEAELIRLLEDEKNADLRAAYKNFQKTRGQTGSEWLLMLASIATTGLCWGSYGPMLHRGQMKMGGSRLRPFICVGIAYFAVAVIVPTLLITSGQEPVGEFTFVGSLWSLGAGAAGALGSLGIILAFNMGGKPIFVMPLVFGGAPVVNTLTSVIKEGTFGQIEPPFYAMLGLVILGAATVLIFAPKPSHAPPKKEEPEPSEAEKAPAI